MKKRDYNRVKAYVEAQRAIGLRAKPSYAPKAVYLHHAVKELDLPADIVTSCLDHLAVEPRPLIGRRERSGFRQKGYSFWSLLGMPLNWPEMKPYGPPEPRKMRSPWGNKRRILAQIRKSKPWVIERWWPEPTNRWHLYIEACTRDLGHAKNGCNDEGPIAPEDQSRLTKGQIARWHFTLEEAIPMCAKVRRKYPTFTFRTRDTSAGDYVMAAIL